MIKLIKHCEKCAHILIHALFAIINFSEDCNNFRIHVFVECCDYLVKYFYFCRCEVFATSKQRLGLLGATLIPWWRLICVTKVAIRALVAVGIATDDQIKTSTITTKYCSILRMTVDCVAIFTVNDRTFERLHVVWVS